ncbi:MAG: MarR family transcriptional regulator [Xanthomonadales bacterium]|nr:MarR family transcriptional regulator [Xanthomonadales bacterium]
MSKDIIDELLADWSEQRPDLDPAAMGVVLRVQMIAKILGDAVSQCLQAFDLHWWQYDVLSALRRQGEPYTLAASELAESGMLTSGAVTNRIDRLEQAGLVERVRDSADRRRVLVRLSAEGHKRVDAATEARFEAAGRALNGLSRAQRRQLGDLLRAFVLSCESADDDR